MIDFCPKRINGMRRTRGSIEPGGNSLRVKVYAGVDPLTGKRLYLTESTTDEREADRTLTRLQAQVDEQANAKTKATLGAAVDELLQVHDVEESAGESYKIYIRRFIRPALGDEPIEKISARVLERFYAELRRCRAICDGKPAINYRLAGDHECRVVRHRRPAWKAAS